MNQFYHNIYFKTGLLLCVYTAAHAGGEPLTEQDELQESYTMQEQGPNGPNYGPRGRSYQPQPTKAPAPRLSYNPKMVTFDKAARQGKLSLAGMLTQIGANTLGQMGVNDGDRTMVKIATGLQGMGQAMSTINATRDPWGRLKGGLQDQKTYYDKHGNLRPQYQKQNQQFNAGNTPPSGRGNTPVLTPIQKAQPNVMPNPVPQPVMQPQRQLGIKKQIVPQKSAEQTVVEKKENKQERNKKEQNRNF